MHGRFYAASHCNDVQNAITVWAQRNARSTGDVTGYSRRITHVSGQRDHRLRIGCLPGELIYDFAFDFDRRLACNANSACEWDVDRSIARHNLFGDGRGSRPAACQFGARCGKETAGAGFPDVDLNGIDLLDLRAAVVAEDSAEGRVMPIGHKIQARPG